MPIKIFVEGIADQKFLQDYILWKYKIKIPFEDLVPTGGWTKFTSKGKDGELVRNKMTQNTDNDGTNLLIFDADHNFKQRIQDLKYWREKWDLEFEIFLWPNNKASGDLEVLLENIITNKNKAIFNCWEQYERCLRSKIIDGRDAPLTTPARKTKIYGYLEALLGDSKSQKEKIKERNRNYKNEDFWDLNSDFLDNLKTFLDQHFSK